MSKRDALIVGLLSLLGIVTVMLGLALYGERRMSAPDVPEWCVGDEDDGEAE